MKTTSSGAVRFVAIMLSMSFITFVVQAYRNPARGPNLDMAMAFVPLLLVVLLCWVFRWRMRRSRLIMRMQELGRKDCKCPGCTYDLAGTVEDSDGCRVCPECGGAWRCITPMMHTPDENADSPNLV
jgi:hypothetical protein